MTRPPAVRRRLLGALLFGALAFGASSELMAQPAGGAGPAAGPASPKPTTKPMYIQGFVVFLLMGAAVYSVCRSSSRV